MRNTKVAQTSPRPKTHKYQHVVFSIDLTTPEGRQEVRDLIRANFRFVMNNLNAKENRKYVGVLTDMSMWLLEDDMLRDPALAKAFGLNEKSVNHDLAQIGQFAFDLVRGQLNVTLNRRSYFARLQQQRHREQRMRIAADLIRSGADLAEVA